MLQTSYVGFSLKMTANVHNICKVWTKSSLLFFIKTMNAIKLIMFYGEYDVQLHYVG